MGKVTGPRGRDASCQRAVHVECVLAIFHIFTPAASFIVSKKLVLAAVSGFLARPPPRRCASIIQGAHRESNCVGHKTYSIPTPGDDKSGCNAISFASCPGEIDANGG